MVVGTLSSYGRDSTATSAEILAKEFPGVLPGGFAVVDRGRVIAPGCCCGLETWRDWLGVVRTRRSPWMGHDPAPLVEVLEDSVHVWTDGGLTGKPKGESPIVFSRHEFEKSVQLAANDLSEFEDQLRTWLFVHAKRYWKGIANHFRQIFISGGKDHQRTRGTLE